MNVNEVLAELESMGDEKNKQMLMKNHGIREPCFGVKIGDMKQIQKRVKKDHGLALALYETGNYDAMYLAGLIADDARMTKRDLQRWVKAAYGALGGYTVPWVAAGSPHGWSLGLTWIESPKAPIAVAGWNTLGCVTALKADADLDLPELERLLERVRDTIHGAPDGVRYAMNGFLISAGCYVARLTGRVKEYAKTIGTVTADSGNNACQVPSALEYIAKVEKRGTIGKKRKSVKC